MKSYPVTPNEAATLFQHCADRLPRAMPASTRAVLSRLVASVVEFGAGDTLVHLGSSFNALHLVVDGAFKSVMLGEDGQQQVIHFYWPSELMALDAFSSRTHATDLVALETARVYEFPFASIESEALKDAAFFESLLGFVSDRLVEAEGDQFMLGSLQATQRLAFFLTTTRQAREHAHLDPVVIDLPMTRRDIASYLGLTTESVSRLLGWMERQAMIRVDRRRITLLDANRVKALLEDTPGMSPLTNRSAAMHG